MADFFINLGQYFTENWQEILTLTGEHIQLTFLSIAIAIAIGVPLGIFISYVEPLKKPVLGFAKVMQAVPSLALLGFLIPFLGIGARPAIVMIVIYSLLPIIENTVTGLGNIGDEVLESARGIGMTSFQILSRVKIPMALPVIMAGVRISAVASVGLVTIAAFIGAGGLGYLVYAGIRTVSTAQILAGAIPACIIALVMDWFMGKIEKAVTPISLQNHEEITDEVVQKNKRQKSRVAVATVLIVALAIVLTVVPFTQSTDNKVVFGAKNFTEQEIVAEMYVQLLDDRTDLDVELKKGLGSTSTIFDALSEGSLDASFDYTGTIFGSIMDRSDDLPPDEIYDISKNFLYDEYKFEALRPIGFNNTYTFAVTQQTADEYNLKSFSDLADASEDLVLGCTIEFMNRPDGLPGVSETYGFHFKSVEAIDDTPRYVALENDDIQVIDAYSTDALINKYDLVVLEDDLGFFPPYHGFALVREDTLQKHPEIQDVLSLLDDTIDDEQMAAMNYRVDELGEKPADVAHEFLSIEGLL